MVAALRCSTSPGRCSLLRRITPAQAASLVVAARRSDAWNTFLAPLDVGERLARSKETENEYIARDAIARALRATFESCRAPSRPGKKFHLTILIATLASAIRVGSSDHFEKARVGAFAARHEVGILVSRVEPPLVDDIAAACRRLPDATRRNIDEALMLIDEPLALAHLLQSAPAVMRDKVRARVDALSPDDAARSIR